MPKNEGINKCMCVSVCVWEGGLGRGEWHIQRNTKKCQENNNILTLTSLNNTLQNAINVGISLVNGDKVGEGEGVCHPRINYNNSLLVIN